MEDDPKRKKFIKTDAFSLFPGLMRKIDADFRPKVHKGGALPPPPPDVSWLSTGILKNKDQTKDVPAALVLMTDSGAKGSVALALEKSGYHVEYSETADDALHKLTSITFAVVALHTGFEGGVSPAESTVHNYLAKLPMDRRRRIFYILLGPAFQTLYNLEALSLSANLVVNDAQVEHLSIIFKKSFGDYIELFGPLLETIETYR
jgi:hypothetical protein